MNRARSTTVGAARRHRHPRRGGAWIRYGGYHVAEDDIDHAIRTCDLAVLQPGDVDVLRRLKTARPDMIVLCYKCLSSVRRYEADLRLPTSGVGWRDAERGDWLARRPDGSLIEWRGHPGHYQARVWDARYRTAWAERTADELAATEWDGVLADNDVYDDYYGVGALEQGRTWADLRRDLLELVTTAGGALASIGKVLVPNIAEARREPGRWAAHAAFGGGYEETWTGYSPTDYLDLETVRAQAACLDGPGIRILRSPISGSPDGDRRGEYGLALAWILDVARTSFLSACDDSYRRRPGSEKAGWDLGEPVGSRHRRGGTLTRRFETGWAAANMHSDRNAVVRVPSDARTTAMPGRTVRLRPREGLVVRT